MAIKKTYSRALQFYTFTNTLVSSTIVLYVATSLLTKSDYNAKLTNTIELNYGSNCSNLKLIFTKMKFSQRSGMVRL